MVLPHPRCRRRSGVKSRPMLTLWHNANMYQMHPYFKRPVARCPPPTLPPPLRTAQTARSAPHGGPSRKPRSSANSARPGSFRPVRRGVGEEHGGHGLIHPVAQGKRAANRHPGHRHRGPCAGVAAGGWGGRGDASPSRRSGRWCCAGRAAGGGQGQRLCCQPAEGQRDGQGHRLTVDPGGFHQCGGL